MIYFSLILNFKEKMTCEGQLTFPNVNSFSLQIILQIQSQILQAVVMTLAAGLFEEKDQI